MVGVNHGRTIDDFLREVLLFLKDSLFDQVSHLCRVFSMSSILAEHVFVDETCDH